MPVLSEVDNANNQTGGNDEIENRYRMYLNESIPGYSMHDLTSHIIGKPRSNVIGKPRDQGNRPSCNG